MHNALSIMLGWQFLVAAYHKLSERQGYQELIQAWQIVPAFIGRQLVVLLAAVELLLVAGFVFESLVLITTLVGAGLLLLYAAAISINIARGRRELNCGCSGLLRRYPMTWRLVARNLLLVCLTLFWGSSAGETPHGWAAWGAATGLGLLFIVTWHAMNDIMLGYADPDDN